VAAAAPSFYERVYALVRTVPRGAVVTYGQVAHLLGQPRGARAVGWALRALAARARGGVPSPRLRAQGATK
jgi:methylated-DNA-protein-cysteine methyltransferase-like protein